MNERERKIERTIPVQSRVDLKTLAEMDMYWRSIDVEIRSMSQLLSWTVDLCHTMLDKNSMLPEKLETVADCHVYLERRGLYQRKMKERAMAKINAAMRFENLRFEGIDPEQFDGREYNIVHNKNSVVPYSARKDTTHVSDEEYKRVVGMSREEAREIDSQTISDEEVNRQKKAAIEASRKSGQLAEPHYGKKELKGGIVIDVDENLRKMKEADEKLKDF